MKKILCLLLVLLLAGCGKEVVYDYPQSAISDMSGYNGLVTNQFYDETIDHFLTMASEKKTAIVYFGYDSCVWCNCVVPVLNEVSIEKDIPVYYVDYHATENYENKEGFEKVNELLKDFLDTDEQGELAFYFPTIVYLQEGTVIDVHIGTVSGHDATVSGLSEKQTARLKYVLEKQFDGLFKR